MFFKVMYLVLVGSLRQAKKEARHTRRASNVNGNPRISPAEGGGEKNKHGGAGGEGSSSVGGGLTLAPAICIDDSSSEEGGSYIIVCPF